MARASSFEPLRRVLLALALVGAVGATACAGPSATSRAQALARQNREDEAVTVLQQRLARHPDDVAARRLLIRLLGSTGDLLAARAQVDELARRLPPNDPTPYIELGHALELTHRYDEALAAYDEAAAASPASPDGPREGGMRAARWGELEEARPRLEEALRRGTNDSDTWHTLGLVRLHLEDFDGAASAYRAGAASDPRCGECWLGLASVGLVRGDAKLALDAYDRVVALSPRFASAQLGRAWALAQLGRKVEAARALDAAQELGAPPGFVARQRAALANPVAPAVPSAGPASPGAGASPDGDQRAE
jgi:tetratricopeptide (TPR) repeat protein